MEKSATYPLKEVTYPVDYGYLPGFLGEDGHELDFFVGTDKLFEAMGYIKVFRPESEILEHKFYISLSKNELQEVLKTFKPVLRDHGEFKRVKDLLIALESFQIKSRI